MSVLPLVTPRFRAFDANGDPLAGGLLYAYAAGTTTPLDTFTTRAGDVANTNPVVLNANGEADVWMTSGVEYKFILKDSAGVTQWTADNVPASQDLAILPDGTLAVPSLSFASDSDTGLYRPAANQIGVATGGALAALFTATQLHIRDGSVGGPALTFQADPDTGLYRIGADQIGVVVGGVLVGTFDASGLLGLVRAAAPSGTIGVQASTTGTGSGGNFNASAGTGIALSVIGNSTKAPLHITAQSEPSGHAIGDLYVDANGRLWIGNASDFIPSGSGVALESDATPVGNVGAGEDDLLSHSLAANTLLSTQRLEMRASGSTANNVAAKTLKVYFGATAVLSAALTSSIAADYFVTLAVIPTGGSAQRYVARVDEVNQATGAVKIFAAQGTTSEAETAAITLKCTGTASNNNDIIQNTSTLLFL
jgi:hypothetical protein